MVKKPPGRNRPVDSGVPRVLPEFLAKLSRATCWTGDLSQFIDGSRITPGSAKSGWCVSDPSRFGVEYLWQELLSKFDDGKSSVEKELKTWERFKEAEEMCASTNQRFSFDRSQLLYRDAVDVYALISSARKNIRRVLGKFDWNLASEGFSFTSGASTRVPRRHGNAAYKYSGIPETTLGNLDLATTAIRMVPLWEKRLRLQGDSGLCNKVPGNKIITVPKNYKTNRVIAVEPCMNMYVQKGIASMIRRRLRKVGIDIRSQQLNQDLAMFASKTDGMATIDMSMASDTVSLELVRFLLPPDWLTACEQCRSPLGVLPSGENVLYRKFSSMGNGLTFELETLIFWSLCSAICSAYGVSERLIAVYGDDVIVPSSVAQPLIDLLAFCGFRTNDSKTFIDGPFRESCGKHYLSGFDVTPFYVKEDVCSLTDLFLLHNQLYRWCLRNQWNTQWNRSLMEDLLAWLRSQAPSAWRRPRLPDGRGDGAFIGTFDQCRPKPASTTRPGRKPGKRDGWEGFMVEVIQDTERYADFFENEDGTVVYGRETKEGVIPCKSPPDELGRLLSSLVPCTPHPLSHLKVTDVVGAIPLGPRKLVVTTLVPQYSTLDPFRASVPA
jgi:hypothetical protein